MVYLVRFREYTFGGLRQRTITVGGTAIRGTATEQPAGGWGWFLRYPDGELAGEGRATTWEDVLEEIRAALLPAARCDTMTRTPAMGDAPFPIG